VDTGGFGEMEGSECWVYVAVAAENFVDACQQSARSVALHGLGIEKSI